MSLAKLQKLRNKYIQSIRNRPAGYNDHVEPSLMAKKLEISDVKATALLYLLEKDGKTKHVFRIYSSDGEFIREYNKLSDIPEEIETDSGEILSQEQLAIDLIFLLNPNE